jgi:hypothetical protein
VVWVCVVLSVCYDCSLRFFFFFVFLCRSSGGLLEGHQARDVIPTKALRRDQNHDDDEYRITARNNMKDNTGNRRTSIGLKRQSTPFSALERFTARTG